MDCLLSETMQVNDCEVAQIESVQRNDVVNSCGK